MTETRAESRGIAWAGAVNLIGGALGSVIGLLLAAIVGHRLGTVGAGTYFLVVAVFMIVSSVTELGADTGLVRYVSAARACGRESDVPRLARIALGPVLVAGVLVVVLAAATVRTYPQMFDSLPASFVVLTAAIAVLSSLLAVILSIVRGLGGVLAYPLLQSIGLPVLRLVGVSLAVLAGWGVVGLLGAWLVPVVIILAIATAVAVRMTTQHAGGLIPAPVQAAERRRLTGEFWAFSATRGLSAAVEILLEWMDVLLVGVLTSPEQAGIYAVVTRCARAGEVIQTAARVAVGPQISAALARGDLEVAREIYGLVTAAMIWLAWPLFMLLAVFGDAVLTLFGPGFHDGATSLAVLCVAMALTTAAGTVQTILLMGGRSSWQLADKSLALALNIALDLALIPLWGIEGAAVAWAVTIAVDTAIVVWQVQWIMGVRPQGDHVLVAAALSVAVVGILGVMTRVVLGSSLPVLGGALILIGAIYVPLSWLLRRRLGLVALIAHRS